MKFVVAAYLAVAAIFSMVAAECPNACSAHGKCGAYDMCLCYRNWMSNDCSESKLNSLIISQYRDYFFGS
jgi:hypothetical protein